MATIIDGARWRLTDKAAENLEEKMIIKKCDGAHIDILPVDLPIYHLDPKRPDEIGYSNLYAYIRRAEERVEK